MRRVCLAGDRENWYSVGARNSDHRFLGGRRARFRAGLVRICALNDSQSVSRRCRQSAYRSLERRGMVVVAVVVAEQPDETTANVIESGETSAQLVLGGTRASSQLFNFLVALAEEGSELGVTGHDGRRAKGGNEM